MYAAIAPDLERMGHLAVNEYKAMGDNADANEPRVEVRAFPPRPALLACGVSAQMVLRSTLI